jgi:hypothetical protein
MKEIQQVQHAPFQDLRSEHSGSQWFFAEHDVGADRVGADWIGLNSFG